MNLRKSFSYVLIVSSLAFLGIFLFLIKHLEYSFPLAVPLWASFVSFYLYRAINHSGKNQKILAVLFPIFLLGVVEIPWGLKTYYSLNASRPKDLYEYAKSKAESVSAPIEKMPRPKKQNDDSRTQGSVDMDYHLAWLANSYYPDGIRFVQMPANYRSKSLNLNSLGFRGPEFSSKKPNAYRVLVLGGSAAFGGQAPTDESIASHQLEILLNQNASPGRRYEVFNLSVPTGNSWMDNAIFGTYGLSLEPDMAIFLTGSSDLAGSAANMRHVSEIIKTELSEKKTAYLFKRAVFGGSQLALRVIHRVHFLDFILSKTFGVDYWWGKWIQDDVYNPNLNQKDYDFYREKYFEKMENIYKVGEKAGVEVVTFHLPHISTSLPYKKKLTKNDQKTLKKIRGFKLFYLNHVERIPQILKKGKGIAGKYGFGYLDLTRIFDDHKSDMRDGSKISYDPNGPMFVSGGHWTAGGNRRVAEAIFEAIKEKALR